MSSWSLQLALAPDGAEPIFLQIARAVADAIRVGRLRPRQRLPGSRRLAATLGVHRNTVLAAYDELAAEGWIEPAHGRGTFVSTAIPDERPRRLGGSPRRRGLPPRTRFELPPAPSDLEPRRPPASGSIVMADGTPDVRRVPAAALWRAYRRTLARGAAGVLGYGDPRGHRGLRGAIAEMLSTTRGLAAAADDLVVTRGSQMALYLVARALIRPGDLVAVEALGYRPAWAAFRAAGARLLPVPVDRDGLDVGRLAELAARRRLRAVYVTPHHQYPTTAVLKPARRLALLALAAARDLAIVEDDYDNEYHYQGRPVLPLASADPLGAVVYVGTLSKVLAPALRIGYVVAPAPLLDRLTALRQVIDGQGDPITEAAVAELLEDGELARHLGRTRRLYRARRDALVAALRRELGEVAEVTPPPGGMAMWVRTTGGVDVDAWARRARAAGVVFTPGRSFAFDGRPLGCLRLGFARCDEAELRLGVRRMAAALRG